MQPLCVLRVFNAPSLGIITLITAIVLRGQHSVFLWPFEDNRIALKLDSGGSHGLQGKQTKDQLI